MLTAYTLQVPLQRQQHPESANRKQTLLHTSFEVDRVKYDSKVTDVDFATDRTPDMGHSSRHICSRVEQTWTGMECNRLQDQPMYLPILASTGALMLWPCTYFESGTDTIAWGQMPSHLCRIDSVALCLTGS